MNGGTRRDSQHTVQANGRPSHQPLTVGQSGIISNVTAALQILQAHNAGVLSQAIAQLEAAHEIQNELISARAAYSQVSSDLRKAVDQNLVQTTQLQESKGELHSMSVKLHGAREQLLLLEKKLEDVGVEATARERQLTTAREAEKDRQIETLSSALQVANARIADLNSKLQSVTTTAHAVETVEPATLSSKALETNTFCLRALDRWLSSSSEQIDDAATNVEEMNTSLVKPARAIASASSNHAEPPTEPHDLSDESKDEITQLVKSCFQDNKDEKKQMFSQLKSLRAQYSNVLDIARTSISRNLALETAFKSIRDLNKEFIASVPNAPAKADGDVEMDEVRTEAATEARQSNNRTPSIKSATMSPLISSNMSQPPTPSQPMLTFGSVSPQRKRQRTSVASATPESLPRDDELYAFVQLANAAYDIQSHESGSNQLICKACQIRHKSRPDYPVTHFDYDLDRKITVPSLANAEQIRTRIRPWVAHLQEKHQAMYAGSMAKLRSQANPRRSSITPSN